LPIGLDPDLIFDMKSSQRELLSVLGLSFLLNVTLYFCFDLILFLLINILFAVG